MRLRADGLGGRAARLATGVVLLSAASSFAQPAPVPDPVEFFERQIRPLLAERCFRCHSTQLATPFGGLRLDSRQGLLEGGDSGPAIVPGRPDDSRLIQVVRGRPRLMPPTGALAEAEIASLTTWVEMGAPWSALTTEDVPDPTQPFDLDRRRRAHWAWQPISPAPVPPVQDEGWSTHPVDRFVLAALERNGLTPTRPANPGTLVRRLSFDLHGLPPGPGEIAAFVGNPDRNAYEQLVDRYLESPRFGERWARHWMDLVRYAESHGSEGDPDTPLAWRYRDYLIRAFNGDVGYDQLVREHLAGDLLPSPRLNDDEQLNESIIATAHFRMLEHGYQPVDPWDDRLKWADNQVDVVSKAFLGLTVSCARCHDHKFDAISQQDYYSLLGTLYGARPTQRAIDAPGVVDKNRDRLVALKASIKAELASVWRAHAADPEVDLLGPAEDDPTTPGRGADGSVLAVWHELNATGDDRFGDAWLELSDRWRETLESRREHNQGGLEPGWDLTGRDYDRMVRHGAGAPERPSAPGEFYVPDGGRQVINGIYPSGVYTHLLSSKHNGVIQTPRFTIDRDYLSLRVLGSDLSFAQLIIENYAVPRGGIYHLRYSPKSDQMNWTTWDTSFWKGFTAYVELATRDDVTQFAYDPEDSQRRPRPTRRTDGRSSLGASHIVFHDERDPPQETNLPVLQVLGVGDDSMVDRPRSAAELESVVRRRLLSAIDAWRDDRLTDEQAVLLDELIREDRLPRTLAELPTVAPLVVEYRALEREIPIPRRAPGVIEESAPDHPLLIRGDPRRAGDPVARAFLSALDGRPYRDPSLVRLRLAEAVTARDNPLMPRVAANRVWRHLFGHGLVRTVDNFGRLGNPPSHPELLDYLARRFIEDGYSVKGLIKTLVMTASYRLSTQGAPEAARVDPTNRLLQHANLRRLDAEAIRDAVLAVSGRLDLRMYGPSVSVYYPRGKGKTENTQTVGPIDGAGRRSIYQEIRRNVHNPFLEVFDLPKPATTRGHRDATNVPAQSLTMLNSPFVIGQAAVWGRRLAEGEASTIRSRIDHMFLRALGRPPTPDERDRASRYVSTRATARVVPDHLVLYDAEVWQDLAHSLFNLKEFLFVR